MDRGVHKRIASILAIALGLIFVVTGAARIFVIIPFSQTISSITYLSQDSARFLAGAVIAFELAGGVLLLLRYKTSMVAMGMCFLIGFFIWVLYSAVALGRESYCYCSAVLNIDVPNHVELTFNLILFNLLGLVAFLETTQRRIMPATGWQKFFTMTIAGTLLYLQIGMVLAAYERINENTKTDIHRALMYAIENSKDFAFASEGKRLIFLQNFHDFDCLLCLDDFVALCDAINAQLQHHSQNRAVIIFRQANLDSVRLVRWALGSGISLPIAVAPDSLFSHIGIGKSLAAVVNKSGEHLFVEQMPLSAKRREDLLMTLSN